MVGQEWDHLRVYKKRLSVAYDLGHCRLFEVIIKLIKPAQYWAMLNKEELPCLTGKDWKYS